jgi:hypothetical protein
MKVLPPEDGLRVLGAPVGSDAFQAAFVARQLSAASAAAAKLTALGNTQVALQLLRYCAVSRPVMLLRTVPPACTLPAAAAFDEGTRRTLAALVRQPAVPEEAWQQASLPLRPGLGLSLAAATAAPAFAASWAHFKALLPSLFPSLAPLLALPHFPATRLGFAASAAQQLLAAAPAVLPAAAARLPAAAAAAAAARLPAAAAAAARPLPARGGDQIAKLQHRLASVSIAARRQQLLANASLAAKARLLSAAAKGASAWLSAIPSCPELSLSNTAFCIAVATLLGLPVPLALPRHCLPGCDEVLDKAGLHLSLCKHEGGAILRHDRVVDTVVQLCHAAGVACQKEAHHWVEDNLRLDVAVVEFGDGGRDVGTDTKIVHPVSAGALAAGSHHTPLATALAGVRQKRAKYEEKCAAANMDFSPLVWEVFGATSPCTLRFLKALIGRVSRSDFVAPNWAAASPSSYWLQRFAVTLQRYNARKIEHLAAVCRQARPR